MLSKQNKKRLGYLILLSIFGVALYVGAMEMLKNGMPSFMETDENKMSNNEANGIRRNGKMPHQWSEGPFYPNNTMSCASKQLDKLDDCDDDNSPNVGSHWEEYILNQ